MKTFQETEGLVQEQPGYFLAAENPLYGVWHAPRAGEGGARLPVLIAPPLFEERKSAWGALTSLARALAAAGHPALRFDWRGSGESGGDPGARRWSDFKDDLAAARETLAELSGRPEAAVLGLRLGASAALQESSRLGAKAVVALAPVVQGAAQARLWRLRSIIRGDLTAQAAGAQSPAPRGPTMPRGAPADDRAASAPAPEQAVDLDGFAAHPEFLSDVAALNLLQLPAFPPDVPVLLLQLSHRREAAPESEALRKALGPACELQCLRLEPFWDRVDDVDTRPVEEAVVKFLQRTG